MLKQIYSFNLYKQQIGLYSKEKVNSNGYWLLEFSQSNHIRLIHTLFVYKKYNCSALESLLKRKKTEAHIRKENIRTEIKSITFLWKKL